MRNQNFTIVDVETTGSSPAFSRVIEIGLLRVERGEVVQKYKSLINPGTEIPEFISDMTGILQKMVKNAPTFENVAEELISLFEDSIFVAHNSAFDYSFLRSEFRRAGFMFSMDSLCTVRLSRVLYPEYKRHNLSALIERFDFKCKNRHRAYDDAKVLWDFLQYAHKNFPSEHLQAAIDRTIKKIAPACLDSTVKSRQAKQRKMERVLVQELEYIEDI